MANEKFTPAPWVMGQSDYFNEATKSHLVVITEGEDEWEICHLCDGIDGSIGETMIANGRLIAQAPAMYAKLQSIHKQLTAISEHLPPNIVGVGKVCEEILTILAAARGEVKQPTT